MRSPGRFWSFLFLRCPNCRRGRLFNSWIRWIEMNDRCPCCGLAFYPESGYFVGSIYINYGATVAVVIVSLLVVRDMPERFQLIFFSCLAALRLSLSSDILGVCGLPSISGSTRGNHLKTLVE